MPGIGHLIAGFRRFRYRYFSEDRTLYDRLLKGQSPKVMVIACSDSRVDPAILLDCEPGDLFTVRNVANLVPPCDADGHHHGTSAAIEFAVKSIGIEHIVVMGHTHCAGIRALLQGLGDKKDDLQFVSRWVEIAAEARDHVLEHAADSSEEEQLHLCEEEAILVSLTNLMSFPWLKKKVEAGELFLHGWYFNLEAGEILAWNPDTGLFELLGKGA